MPLVENLFPPQPDSFQPDSCYPTRENSPTGGINNIEKHYSARSIDYPGIVDDFQVLIETPVHVQTFEASKPEGLVGLGIQISWDQSKERVYEQPKVEEVRVKEGEFEKKMGRKTDLQDWKADVKAEVERENLQLQEVDLTSPKDANADSKEWKGDVKNRFNLLEIFEAEEEENEVEEEKKEEVTEARSIQSLINGANLREAEPVINAISPQAHDPSPNIKKPASSTLDEAEEEPTDAPAGTAIIYPVTSSITAILPNPPTNETAHKNGDASLEPASPIDGSDEDTIAKFKASEIVKAEMMLKGDIPPTIPAEMNVLEVLLQPKPVNDVGEPQSKNSNKEAITDEKAAAIADTEKALLGIPVLPGLNLGVDTVSGGTHDLGEPQNEETVSEEKAIAIANTEKAVLGLPVQEQDMGDTVAKTLGDRVWESIGKAEKFEEMGTGGLSSHGEGVTLSAVDSVDDDEGYHRHSGDSGIFMTSSNPSLKTSQQLTDAVHKALPKLPVTGVRISVSERTKRFEGNTSGGQAGMRPKPPPKGAIGSRTKGIASIFESGSDSDVESLR